jgi:hypothetical protein
VLIAGEWLRHGGSGGARIGVLPQELTFEIEAVQVLDVEGGEGEDIVEVVADRVDPAKLGRGQQLHVESHEKARSGFREPLDPLEDLGGVLRIALGVYAELRALV